MGERKGLIERLRKRAEDEREIQRNNEAVAEALSGQLEAFRRRDGSHNNFAVRLGLDHRSCAKKDASLAADWEEAATTIACLSEALAEAEKKGAEALRHIQEHFPGAAAEFEAVYERTAPPRDLSQGDQHG